MDFVEAVEEKGLDAASHITVYGYTADDAQEMAQQLARLGFEHVDVFGQFAEEWAADPERPLERLPRYRHLVHPDWLQARLNGEAPEEPGNAALVVCHAHFQNPADYARGHIPGALSLDTNWLEAAETWNRRSPEELDALLCSLGITSDTTVVLYGRHSFPTYDMPDPGSSAGHLAAIRSAAILLYAGVEDVRILNGGIHSWIDAGLLLSTEHVAPIPADAFGAQIPAHPEYIVDIEEAKRLLAASDGELVSVRSLSEFIGERSGYHYIEKTGRIPGAVFGNCGSDAYHMENYRNFDYTTREYGEIARNWAEVGVVPEKHVAFYCGTGWRGAEAFMNAWLMGWPRACVYDGGWFEWSSDPANPIVTGEP
jgi:molybdopterin synthase sulfurtransferase